MSDNNPCMQVFVSRCPPDIWNYPRWRQQLLFVSAVPSDTAFANNGIEDSLHRGGQLAMINYISNVKPLERLINN